MPRRPRRPAGFVLAVTLLACACGGSSPVTPTAPVPSQPASPAPPAPPPPSPPLSPVTLVAATLPQAQGPGFFPGQRVQLTALATREDGTTFDCTASAAWTTSNDAVVRFDDAAAGEARAADRGQASLVAECEGRRSDALIVSVGGGVRIMGLEGYPHFLTGGISTLLTAHVVDDRGNEIAQCTLNADWTSSNTTAISFFAITKNRINVHRSYTGDVVLGARCEGHTGELRVRVDRYEVSGTIRSTTGAPIPNVRVKERYSQVDVLTDAAGHYSTRFFMDTPEPVVSAVGYETNREPFAWDRRAVVRRDLTLPPVPGIVLQSAGQVCNLSASSPSYGADCTAQNAVEVDVHRFRVPRGGTLRVLTHWPDVPGGSGVDSDLHVRLLCGSTRVREVWTRDNQGGGLSVAADPACDYELQVRNATFRRILPYQFTVSVQ